MILPQGISGARTTAGSITPTGILPQGISGARTTQAETMIFRSRILPQGISGARTTWRCAYRACRFYHRE